MEFVTEAQVDGIEEAAGMLCERMREEPQHEELAMMDNVVDRASVFGDGLISERDGEARVALEVVFAPSEPGAEGESWEALLIREQGTWKVCGFQKRSN